MPEPIAMTSTPADTPTPAPGGISMRGRRALITGGLGLVGSHIADLLVDRGAAEVLILDDLSRGRRSNVAWAEGHGNVAVVIGDIRDRGLLDRLMDGIDVVFHQAALRITQCAENPALAMDVLVDGTFQVVDAASRIGRPKIIAASSASVYGAAERFPTAEDHHPWTNDTLYGAAKAFGEGLLRSFHATHGLDYVALRYFNVYGPRMDAHGRYTEVLVRWMDRIRSGDAPLILGDGAQTMDFVYAADVARANVLAAEAPVTDAVFNVASGTETSLVELAGALLGVMGAEQRIEYGPARSVNNVRRRLADTRRAREHLGFRVEVPLEEGLRRLVDWWDAGNGRTAEPIGSRASERAGSVR
jgi:UDP-glucose 4-epimerase